MSEPKNGPNAQPGPGVDAQGRTVVDPTRNVLDLVSAAILRQDDLRLVESRHIREIVELRAKYDGELREAETARIDAIRAVDVGAVNRAAEVAATQATTLAAAVATSAETLRTQVAATATAGVVGLAAALEPIQKDISELRRYQYEGQGQKIQVSETQAKGVGVGMWIGIGVSVFGLFLTAATIVIGVYFATH